MGLTVGAALIIRPELGDAIRPSSGDTPTDFVTALLVAGNSLSIVGSGDHAPHTTGTRVLFCSIRIGASVLSGSDAESYGAALETLRRAGIEARPNSASYADQRSQWEPLVRRIAPTFGYGMDEIARRQPQNRPASAASAGGYGSS
jgi:hypothetical protein